MNIQPGQRNHVRRESILALKLLCDRIELTITGSSRAGSEQYLLSLMQGLDGLYGNSNLTVQFSSLEETA